ncbi:unnamed protein product [Caenorhabditis sp. 36 PRJEB53466]|nr:unnamed protein product [Caenorhabditis sp. 36 PRJEB53466]
MKEFVSGQINSIASDHEKMVSGWKSVELSEENIRHLFNLFSNCSRQEIRWFEEHNFLGEEKKEVIDLITKKLTRSEANDEPKIVQEENGNQIVDENKQQEVAPLKQQNKNKQKKKKKKKPEMQQQSEKKSNNTPETTDEKSEENGDGHGHNEAYEVAETENESSEPQDFDIALEDLLGDANKEKEEKTVDDSLSAPETNQRKISADASAEKEYFIEPIVNSKPLPKDDDGFKEPMMLADTYMSPESNHLKMDLRRLANDISIEEKHIRDKMEAGEPVNMDNGVLADFISRANTVLKETEAVTVRKIAEAETRKFLSAVNVTPGPCLETISNELMQDIWPKTNRWRTVARSKYFPQEPEEIDKKTKKKREEQIERAVQAAIKMAGESLSKKQIGQIRKAAIVYRDFDEMEQRELDFRSEHTLKMVEYVSGYEAKNQMDEITCLRLSIAFCTKRRDYYLKMRPKNFMQFSYMYIYLLEKLNSKTAQICACLNYHNNSCSNFDELEELLLNLFHEDYFLDGKDF